MFWEHCALEPAGRQCTGAHAGVKWRSLSKWLKTSGLGAEVSGAEREPFLGERAKTRPNSRTAGESVLSTQTNAHKLMQRGGGFVDCGAELGYRPGDFFFCDYCGWGQEQVISGDAVDAALHGIDEESAGHGGGGDPCGEV